MKDFGDSPGKLRLDAALLLAYVAFILIVAVFSVTSQLSDGGMSEHSVAKAALMSIFSLTSAAVIWRERTRTVRDADLKKVREVMDS